MKVCKVAGPGVTAGQEFAFSIGTTKTTAKAGDCSAPVTLPVGDVTVQETLSSGYEATAIAVSGAGWSVCGTGIRPSAGSRVPVPVEVVPVQVEVPRRGL